MRKRDLVVAHDAALSEIARLKEELRLEKQLRAQYMIENRAPSARLSDPGGLMKPRYDSLFGVINDLRDR